MGNLGTKAKVGIAIGAVVGLAALGGGAMMVLTGGEEQLTAADYVEVQPAPAKKVSVSGTIEPVRAVTLSTHLTSPVQAINVKVGDKVESEQLLGTLNVSQLERQLLAKQASDAAAGVTAQNQIAQAQRQYTQLQEAVNTGNNAEINAADQAMRKAQEAYNGLVADYEADLARRNLAPEILAQDTAVRTARENVFSAAVNAAQLGANVVFNNERRASEEAALNSDRAALASATTNEERAALEQRIATRETAIDNYDRGNIESAFTGVDSATKLVSANKNLDDAQRNYDNALYAVDKSLAQKQREVANAFNATADAASNRESTRLAVQHQLNNSSAAVDDALRSAQANQAATGSEAEQLRLDIASSEIRSPLTGVVTAVVAKEGQAAAGTLLKVADDSSLKVTAEVKETDIAKLAVGQKVEFSTPSTGEKKFTGRVSFISPVAASPEDQVAPAAGTAGGNTGTSSTSNRVTFPVEITVEGNRDGLRLGSSAKARIEVEKQNKDLIVAPTAVFEEEGTTYLLAIRNGILEKVEVTTAEVEDGVQVTGIQAGELVVNEPQRFMHLVGTQVQ